MSSLQERIVIDICSDVLARMSQPARVRVLQHLLREARAANPRDDVLPGQLTLPQILNTASEVLGASESA